MRSQNDLILHCLLEPEDERNFLKMEDDVVDISFIVQHVAYGFWHRIKRAFKLLFTGMAANDIIISEEDVDEIINWLVSWCIHRERDKNLGTFEKFYGDIGENE